MREMLLYIVMVLLGVALVVRDIWLEGGVVLVVGISLVAMTGAACELCR